VYRPLALALFVLAASCGRAADEREPQANSPAELENRLENLADPTPPKEAPPPRIAFLKEVDLGSDFRTEPACRFHREGKLMLVVTAVGGVARVDGRRVPLAVSGPVGPTGGFFTAPGVTLSVGREGHYPGEPAGAAGDWPAGITVGGDREREIERVDGRWRCTR
jgi:hypothetical protein